MKTHAVARSSRGFSGVFFAIVAAAGFFSISSPLLADVTSSAATSFSGIYKVAASTDPMFPTSEAREYFLDFGKGVQAGKVSGNVAVSMRQNPHVQVRIMAWQYFPKECTLVIGNPYSEGSRNAVVRAMWKMTGSEKGVIFERLGYQMVLHRADASDY